MAMPRASRMRQARARMARRAMSISRGVLRMLGVNLAYEGASGVVVPTMLRSRRLRTTSAGDCPATLKQTMPEESSGAIDV